MNIDTQVPAASLMLMNLNARLARAEAEYAEALREEVQVTPTVSPFMGMDIVEISNEARDMFSASGMAEAISQARCTTCDERRYVDNSSDGTVSFQTPANITPGAAIAAVSAHEAEHLANDRMTAERDDRRVISQGLHLNTCLCPDCGRVFVSGGRAVTMSVAG